MVELPRCSCEHWKVIHTFVFAGMPRRKYFGFGEEFIVANDHLTDFGTGTFRRWHIWVEKSTSQLTSGINQNSHCPDCNLPPLDGTFDDRNVLEIWRPHKIQNCWEMKSSDFLFVVFPTWKIVCWVSTFHSGELRSTPAMLNNPKAQYSILLG